MFYSRALPEGGRAAGIWSQKDVCWSGGSGRVSASPPAGNPPGRPWYWRLLPAHKAVLAQVLGLSTTDGAGLPLTPWGRCPGHCRVVRGTHFTQLECPDLCKCPLRAAGPVSGGGSSPSTRASGRGLGDEVGSRGAEKLEDRAGETQVCTGPTLMASPPCSVPGRELRATVPVQLWGFCPRRLIPGTGTTSLAPKLPQRPGMPRRSQDICSLSAQCLTHSRSWLDFPFVSASGNAWKLRA